MAAKLFSLLARGGIPQAGGISITGNASLGGTGVMIYNANSAFPASGGSYGGLAVSGNGTISLSAPSGGPYTGVVLFQARANTRAIALSGTGATGISGTLYAPSALLTISGNGTTRLGLIVDQLSISGNGTSTLVADGSGTASDASATAGQLLSSDLYVAVDNSNNLLTAGELSRIDASINALGALLAPYGVTITDVTGAAGAVPNVVVDAGENTPIGGLAQGVLGCESSTGTAIEITLVQGWDWYTGSDPSTIGSGQYDFQTVVTHELGHALGLGHSGDPSSVMFGTLASGTVRRTMTAADLAIPDLDSGADGLHAAPTPSFAFTPLAPPTGSGLTSTIAAVVPSVPSAELFSVALSARGPISAPLPGASAGVATPARPSQPVSPTPESSLTDDVFSIVNDESFDSSIVDDLASELLQEMTSRPPWWRPS